MKHNRKHSLRSKGQDIIEYALMLAIVVGIGFLIYNQSNMADKINAVFGNANNLLATVEKESDPAVLHDRNYADAMAKMLKDAIAKGTVQLSDGATVGIYAQNAPNGKADKYNINGLKTGNVTVNGKDYMANGAFYGLWKAGDGSQSYTGASVAQKDKDWYGVEITNNGSSNYTVKYRDGSGYSNASKDGFRPSDSNNYKTETWNP